MDLSRIRRLFGFAETKDPPEVENLRKSAQEVVSASGVRTAQVVEAYTQCKDSAHQLAQELESLPRQSMPSVTETALESLVSGTPMAKMAS